MIVVEIVGYELNFVVCVFVVGGLWVVGILLMICLIYGMFIIFIVLVGILWEYSCLFVFDIVIENDEEFLCVVLV